MRNIAMSYFRNGNGFRNAGGIAKPDWIKDPFLQDIKFIIDDVSDIPPLKIFTTIIKSTRL